MGSGSRTTTASDSVNGNGNHWLFVSAAILISILMSIAIRNIFFQSAMAGMLIPTIRRRYAPAIGLPILLLLSGLYNEAVTRVTPHIVDSWLSRLDLGISLVIFIWCNNHSHIHLFLGICYGTLPLWAAIVLTVSPDHTKAQKALLQAAIIGPIGYLIVPAVGPAWLQFANAPRNCFPSMHVTWAIMLWYFSPRPMRVVSAFLAASTTVATLGLGEHYIPDLIAAIPFSWMMLRISCFSFAGTLYRKIVSQQASKPDLRRSADLDHRISSDMASWAQICRVREFLTYPKRPEHRP